MYDYSHDPKEKNKLELLKVRLHPRTFSPHEQRWSLNQPTKKKFEKNSTPIPGSMTFSRSSVSQALYPNHTRNCRKVNTKLLQKQLKIQKEMKKK